MPVAEGLSAVRSTIKGEEPYVVVKKKAPRVARLSFINLVHPRGVTKQQKSPVI